MSHEPETTDSEILAEPAWLTATLARLYLGCTAEAGDEAACRHAERMLRSLEVDGLPVPAIGRTPTCREFTWVATSVFATRSLTLRVMNDGRASVVVRKGRDSAELAPLGRDATERLRAQLGKLYPHGIDVWQERDELQRMGGYDEPLRQGGA